MLRDKWATSCPLFLNIREEVSVIRKVVPNNVNNDIVNEKVRFKEVMVIDSQGNQLGVMSSREALAKAYESELDLLCVAPKAQPPVCKILDYGKWRFENQKKAKEAKKKQSTVELKALRLPPNIDKGDFDTKLRHARKFIEQGNKVKLDMRFRGRLITRVDVGKVAMTNFIEEISDIAQVEAKPKLEGNTMSCVLAPKKNKKK